MTEIEKKALELVNEVCAERDLIPYYEISRDDFSITEALCRAIEQHEAAAEIETLRAALEARGLEIREKSDD